MGRVERDQLIEVGKIYLPLFVVLYVYTLYNAGDGGDIEARYRGDQYLFEWVSSLNLKFSQGSTRGGATVEKGVWWEAQVSTGKRLFYSLISIQLSLYVCKGLIAVIPEVYQFPYITAIFRPVKVHQ